MSSASIASLSSLLNMSKLNRLGAVNEDGRVALRQRLTARMRRHSPMSVLLLPRTVELLERSKVSDPGPVACADILGVERVESETGLDMATLKFIYSSYLTSLSNNEAGRFRVRLIQLISKHEACAGPTEEDRYALSA